MESFFLCLYPVLIAAGYSMASDASPTEEGSDRGTADRVKIYRIEALNKAVPCQFLVSPYFFSKKAKIQEI